MPDLDDLARTEFPTEPRQRVVRLMDDALADEPGLSDARLVTRTQARIERLRAWHEQHPDGGRAAGFH